MIASRCVIVLPHRGPCPDTPATPLGLCLSHLREAAAELVRITPRAADPDDGRPSAVNIRDLCGRCGGWNHRRTECAA